jgi:hypothetical protein
MMAGRGASGAIRIHRVEEVFGIFGIDGIDQRKGLWMGLMDKVKATTAAATEAAKDAAAKGQAKYDEVQAKKVADGMLRDLGAAFYATKTGRATPATDDEIERLVAALQAHESEHGQITLAPESPAGGPTASPAPPPVAADPASQAPPPPPTAQTL